MQQKKATTKKIFPPPLQVKFGAVKVSKRVIKTGVECKEVAEPLLPFFFLPFTCIDSKINSEDIESNAMHDNTLSIGGKPSTSLSAEARISLLDSRKFSFRFN